MARLSALGEPVRALLDLKPAKAATKRWGWIKKGAPVILEVGGRDMAGGNVSMICRDRLYRNDGKLNSMVIGRDEFAADAEGILEDMQHTLHVEAKGRLEANIARNVTDFAGIERAFADGVKNPGWVEVQWSKPTGPALDKVVERLKALKLTVRNVPCDADAADGSCVFTGDPAVERVLVGRAY